MASPTPDKDRHKNELSIYSNHTLTEPLSPPKSKSSKPKTRTNYKTSLAQSIISSQSSSAVFETGDLAGAACRPPPSRNMTPQKISRIAAYIDYLTASILTESFSVGVENQRNWRTNWIAATHERLWIRHRPITYWRISLLTGSWQTVFPVRYHTRFL